MSYGQLYDDVYESHLCQKGFYTDDSQFHCSMSDIQDGSTLAVGDTVQCVVVPQLGSNRTSAMCLRKIKYVQKCPTISFLLNTSHSSHTH